MYGGESHETDHQNHHSSYAEHKEVLSAFEWKVRNGKVSYVRLKSGHYLNGATDEENDDYLQLLFKYFKKLKLNLTETVFEIPRFGSKVRGWEETTMKIDIFKVEGEQLVPNGSRTYYF